ncbi:MAG: hypothetical protein H7281_12720 [Bacteriovorax sp.]|nr:hypothetical protein [Bacteriovorax sp.]
MSLSKREQQILALIFCLFSDITMVAWLYFKASNYNRYTRLSGTMVDSPDFQFQIYGILLQSMTFALILFLIAQTVVYILAWRNFRGAYLYLKFFAVFGFAVALYITFTASAFALLPVIFYLTGYYVFARSFKELTAAMQTPLLSSTPQ